jgi:flagellar basal-body rod protein FlgB
MLKNAMAGASLAHSAIANNIANVNTPNYRRTDVSFKDALAAADSASVDSDQLQLATTSDRHIGGVPAAQPFQPEIAVDNTTQMRVDRSNVDIDQEMAKLSLNSSYAQSMAQLLQTQYTRLREAVSEQG